MRRWLFKEEPDHFSFDELQMEGNTLWEGVRNNLALKNLRLVSAGDRILYYHTGNEKRVVGVAVCISAGRETGVVIRAMERFRNGVTLAEIKSAGRFNSEPIVRMPRLSVMPVSDDLWKYITEKGGWKEGAQVL